MLLTCFPFGFVRSTHVEVERIVHVLGFGVETKTPSSARDIALLIKSAYGTGREAAGNKTYRKAFTRYWCVRWNRSGPMSSRNKVSSSQGPKLRRIVVRTFVGKFFVSVKHQQVTERGFRAWFKVQTLQVKSNSFNTRRSCFVTLLWQSGSWNVQMNRMRIIDHLDFHLDIT